MKREEERKTKRESQPAEDVHACISLTMRGLEWRAPCDPL